MSVTTYQKEPSESIRHLTAANEVLAHQPFSRLTLQTTVLKPHLPSYFGMSEFVDVFSSNALSSNVKHIVANTLNTPHIQI